MYPILLTTVTNNGKADLLYDDTDDDIWLGTGVLSAMNHRSNYIFAHHFAVFLQ